MIPPNDPLGGRFYSARDAIHAPFWDALRRPQFTTHVVDGDVRTMRRIPAAVVITRHGTGTDPVRWWNVPDEVTS